MRGEEGFAETRFREEGETKGGEERPGVLPFFFLPFLSFLPSSSPPSSRVTKLRDSFLRLLTLSRSLEEKPSHLSLLNRNEGAKEERLVESVKKMTRR